MSEKEVKQGPVESDIETPDQDELSEEELDNTTGGGIIAPHLYGKPSAYQSVNAKTLLAASQLNLNVKSPNTNSH